MARSGHSIHSTSGRHRVHQPQIQKLMDKEIAELKSYLPDWTSAKRRQWKKRKQMYKTWLFNNKKKKEKKDMIKYGRKWMPRLVINQQNQGEVLKRIKDESGEKPGAPGEVLLWTRDIARPKGIATEKRFLYKRGESWTGLWSGGSSSALEGRGSSGVQSG
ncbi:hypothetical protein BD769DRAFT_1386510 [Suillus cothurnatus]|nr:hypothetical protein BD769DRAFT_1386510 [Suillus cothurnatus]